MAKKATNKKENLPMEEVLWKACDALRGSIEPSEYKHVVLSLIFLKYAGFHFDKRRREIINDGLEDFVDSVEFYAAKNVFYLPETARWTYIKENAKQPNVASIVDKALSDIEKENKPLRGALPNNYYEQIGKKCLDITEQIPFEIPSNWKWCRVRNVSNSYIGLTYKPTDIDEKGIIVLRSCNIRNGKLALDDIVRVSSSISEKLLIEENDIIICARNGSKRLVGKSALIRDLTEPMTFGAFMAICKTPIYEYMFAYLQSDLFFGQLRDVSNTTTINQLTQNKFNDFLIPIPPVKEQERIAFKISQLFQELR